MTDRIKVTAAQLGKIIADYLGDRQTPPSASEQVAFDRTYEVIAPPAPAPAPAPITAAAVAHEARLRDKLKATRRAIRFVQRQQGVGLPNAAADARRRMRSFKADLKATAVVLMAERQFRKH